MKEVLLRSHYLFWVGVLYDFGKRYVARKLGKLVGGKPTSHHDLLANLLCIRIACLGSLLWQFYNFVTKYTKEMMKFYPQFNETLGTFV